jgi:hypothetical protein
VYTGVKLPEGGELGEEGELGEVEMFIEMPRASKNKLVLIGLGRPKYVVGCTSSMCECRCSGRL